MDSLDDAIAWATGVRDARTALVEAVSEGLGPDEFAALVRADENLGATHAVVALQAIPGLTKIGCRRALSAAGYEESTPIATIPPGDLRQFWVGSNS